MAEYINCETLLNAFEEADSDVMEDFGEPFYGYVCGFSESRIKNIISNIPKIHVLPKIYGKWILEDTFAPTYHCSECKYKMAVVQRFAGEKMYNFCPNCGAKMDAENFVENVDKGGHN